MQVCNGLGDDGSFQAMIGVVSSLQSPEHAGFEELLGELCPFSFHQDRSLHLLGGRCRVLRLGFEAYNICGSRPEGFEFGSGASGGPV